MYNQSINFFYSVFLSSAFTFYFLYSIIVKLHQAETSNDEFHHNGNSYPFYRDCKVNIERNKKANLQINHNYAYKYTFPYQILLYSSFIKAFISTYISLVVIYSEIYFIYINNCIYYSD